eukprot:11179038-Lingulodinium_polyedra.AAC.1
MAGGTTAGTAQFAMWTAPPSLSPASHRTSAAREPETPTRRQRMATLLRPQTATRPTTLGTP